MKHTTSSITGFAIGASDGEVGHVSDFYFDKKTWDIRYLVVKTGSWLSGRKVLLSPQAIQAIDVEGKRLATNLTTEQVKHSPDIDTEKPVSRQQEIEMHNHYPWNSYWGGGTGAVEFGMAGMMMPVAEPMDQAIHHALQNEGPVEPDSAVNAESALLNTYAVADYAIQAAGEEAGSISDFIFDDSNWQISLLVIDTGNWLAGKKVLLPTKQIKELDNSLALARVDMPAETIKASPAYDATKAITADAENMLNNDYTGD